MPITLDQIKNTIDSGKYSENQLLNLARQYNIPTSQIDLAKGWKEGTAAGHARRISGLNNPNQIYGAAQSGQISPWEAFNLAHGIGAPQAGSSFYKTANKGLSNLFMPDLPGKVEGQGVASGGIGFGGNAGILSQLMGGYINPETAFSNAFQANRAFKGTGNNGEPLEWIPGVGWSSVDYGENGYAFPNVQGHDPDTGIPQYDLSDPRFFDRMIRSGGMKSLMGYDTAPVWARSPSTGQGGSGGLGTGGSGSGGTTGGSGGGTGDPSDFINDPSYEFRRNEALRAIEQSAAAQGNLFSGATGRELERYASDLASQEWGAEFGRRFGLSNQGLQALQIMMGGIPGAAGVGGFPTIGGVPLNIPGAGGNVNLGSFASLINGAAGNISGAGAANALGGLGSTNAWLNTGQSLNDIFMNYWNSQNSQPVGGNNSFF